MKTILYIHGMGGGADSRIPSILNDWFAENRPEVRVVVRTYDFNPDRAAGQIAAWYEELQPALVIGESLGANHALALYDRRSPGSGAPALLLVSPALNAPRFLYALRGAVRIPAIRRWFNRIYKPREGDRQALDFSPETLTAWGAFRHYGHPAAPGRRGCEGAKNPSLRGMLLRTHGDLAPNPSAVHAFFGRRDHYRRTGVVSLNAWRRRFGPGTWTLYDGTHYMEEEHLKALLIPAILQRL